MLDKVASNIVTGSLDWFLKKVLKDHYDKRRQTLSKANEDSIPAIDYILTTCIGKEASYPPETSVQWKKYFAKLESGSSNVFKQTLLIYLKLDANSYLTQKDSLTRARTKDKAELATLEEALGKLIVLPNAFNFTNSIINLATGLWAIDNGDTDLAVSSLSYPTINIENYFESPKEIIKIIVDGLIIDQKPRMALYMSKIHRCEERDENYDRIYAFLLVSSGQLIEALKYERLFSERANYTEILQNFFEMCSQWNVTRSLNCLNLSIEEEDVLNQHLITESRTVTPSGSQTRIRTTSSKPKPRNRSIQVVQRTPSFNDSPARNTRSARKKTVR